MVRIKISLEKHTNICFYKQNNTTEVDKTLSELKKTDIELNNLSECMKNSKTFKGSLTPRKYMKVLKIAASTKSIINSDLKGLCNIRENIENLIEIINSVDIHTNPTTSIYLDHLLISLQVGLLII